MFDVGFWELALVGLICLIVVGPQRLPELVRVAGFWIGKARRTSAILKQGFGPAIALRLTGVDNSIPVYTGNQPGDYGPGFWWFLLAWAPVFLLGLYLLRRFSRPIRQS